MTKNLRQKYLKEPNAGYIARKQNLITGLLTIIRRCLPKNQFARSVSVLAGGTAASQLLGLCAAPIVTRLFSPEDFGLLAVYGGLLGLFTVIASLRYELAILLPEDDQEAANIATLSLLIVVAISVLSILMALLGHVSISRLLGVPILSHYFWLLPFGVLLVGIYQVFGFWALRTKNFTAMSGTRLKQSLTSIIIQILGYKLGPVALLIGHAAGQGMGGFSLGKAAMRYSQFRHVSLSGMV
ncbi:MAG: oligosaccharide flippase family protein, partial [Burkholderiaceae bacterium]